MIDFQVCYQVQATILYQSLLLQQCPINMQQNDQHLNVQEQLLLAQLIQLLSAVDPENSCLFLLSELNRERIEGFKQNRKRQVLELQCANQLELPENNRSYRQLKVDIREEEKLYGEIQRKFQQLEESNVLEMEKTKERIEDFVDHMLEVNLAESSDISELHVAAEYGGPQLTAKLLDIGMSVNSLDDLGRTPLFAAARQGQVETVKLLLQRGAEVNFRDEGGLIPLHGAVWSGSVDTVQALIANESEINVIIPDIETTPLSIAAMFGYLSVVQLLINNGANANIKDSYGDNALMTAIKHEKADVACWLYQNVPNIDVKSDKFNGTPLIVAILKENNDIYRCLLENGFPANVEYEDDLSPLLTAALFGNLVAGEELLKHGADVNYKNEFGNTALHLAAYEGRLQVARLLVVNNADIAAVDAKGRTPEFFAKFRKHDGVAKYLADLRKGRN